LVHETYRIESPNALSETLRTEDLKVYYHTAAGPVKAVNGVSFSLRSGERFGLVGESGSGKSTIAMALLRLIKPPGRIEGGSIVLNGEDLLDLSEEEMRRKRLEEIALVAQGAMNSLNPVKRIRDQFRLAFRDHDMDLSRSEFRHRIEDLLTRVGLRPEVADMFPHELSGGMKQRVCIALAISLSPQVIVADEPSSALDVVVQWQVMDTLRRVQEDLGAAVILIGHDMGLMAQFVDRLGVMYAGLLVEIATVENLFGEPLHPYGQMLIASLPSLEKKGALHGIPGITPSLLNPPGGCPFHPRCPHAMEQCSVVVPRLREVRPNHWAACHLYQEAE
jgi:peptide/nickel transport system ATP-binding protein